MKKLQVSQMINECEKNAIPDEQIDTSEIPELSNLDGFYFGNEKYFKPVKEHFRSKGSRWQCDLNEFLMGAYINGQI